MSTPSLDQLKRAIVISEQIETLQSELAGLFGGQSAPVKATPPKAAKPGKRTMSPETIAKMRTAQLARWAVKKEKPVKSSKAIAKPKVKRNISPEGRAKMAEAAKKRWADNKK